jgi:hypothetical protein
MDCNAGPHTSEKCVLSLHPISISAAWPVLARYLFKDATENSLTGRAKGKSRILVAPFANQGASPPGRRKQRLRQMSNEALLRVFQRS